MAYTLTGDLSGTTVGNTIQTTIVGLKNKPLPTNLSDGALYYNSITQQWEFKAASAAYKHLAIVNSAAMSIQRYNISGNIYNTGSSFVELIDSSSAFDTSTGVYTIPETGTYRISFWGSWGSGTGRSYISLFRNGSLIDEILDIPNAQYCNLSAHKFYNLNAGNTIELLIQSSAVIPASAQLCFYKI